MPTQEQINNGEFLMPEEDEERRKAVLAEFSKGIIRAGDSLVESARREKKDFPVAKEPKPMDMAIMDRFWEFAKLRTQNSGENTQATPIQ